MHPLLCYIFDLERFLFASLFVVKEGRVVCARLSPGDVEKLCSDYEESTGILAVIASPGPVRSHVLVQMLERVFYAMFEGLPPPV